MCHLNNRTFGALPLLIFIMVPYTVLKKVYCPILALELDAMFTTAGYKFFNLTSFIHKDSKIILKNKISSKFMMLSYNNQIFELFKPHIHSTNLHIPQVTYCVYM